MRIPLDYYQILAVTERNLPELEQAYRDRLLQLPRKGYSDAAIESRKQLITLAYQVLSDPQQRERYEAQRLPSVPTGTQERSTDEDDTPPADPHRQPQLEIAPEHFLGGLLILFERGEYEEINSICMPYLGNNGNTSNSSSLHPHALTSVSPSGKLLGSIDRIEPTMSASFNSTGIGDRVIPLKPDIVLTMVFSFLELGSQEWRKHRYEEAVMHFKTAQKILVQENLFPTMHEQIERRLDRLRPYRILALVSSPLDRQEQRQEGIQFLAELLESTCKNEVECQERFGFSSERTIQFIHETLPSLTAVEQRNLFSQIARDSYQLGTNTLNVMQLACTYLYVYALVAQGFAYRNPQSIYTAQQILQHRLKQRLDVTIEQAICALLLGQTEETNRLLATATESPALTIIRQHAQGESDLLSGLCWYIESWLKDEVFPCFRDLVESDPTLNDYYQNRDVQDFIERPHTGDLSILAWGTDSSDFTIDSQPSSQLNLAEQPNLPESHQSDSANSGLFPVGLRRADSLNTSAWQLPQDRLGNGHVVPAMRVEQTPPATAEAENSPDRGDNAQDLPIPLVSKLQGRHLSAVPTAKTIDGKFEQFYPEHPQDRAFVAATASISQLVPTNKDQQLTQRDSSTMVRSRRPRRKPNVPRILLVCAGGLTCLWGIIWLINAAFVMLTTPAGSTSPATLSVQQPIPSSNPEPTQPLSQPQIEPPVGLLTKDIAQQAVKNWLNAKAKSFDRQYQTDRLKDIAVDPALSLALDRVKMAKAEGVHWIYKHPEISIEPIPTGDALATTATIQAQVKESAQYYKNNRLDPAFSYSKKLLVEYNLVRQKDRWYVKNMDVIKSLDSGQ